MNEYRRVPNKPERHQTVELEAVSSDARRPGGRKLPILPL
jgi:hypothetical protein